MIKRMDEGVMYVDKIGGKVQGLNAKLKRFYGLLEDPRAQKHQ